MFMRQKWMAIVFVLLTPMLLYSQQLEKRILFFGDSITAGYGVGEDDAFPARIQHKIDSLGWNFKVVNGGLSGETSAGGLSRINWMLRQPVSVFVLELGGNDGLRGIDLDVTQQNLQKIIDKVKSKYPDATIIITGMQVPPNLGPDYSRDFKAIYPDLAQKNDAELIPYFLDDLAGNSEYMQSDGIHPTEDGHRLLAKKVWKVLKLVLKKKRTENHTN